MSKAEVKQNSEVPCTKLSCDVNRRKFGQMAAALFGAAVLFRTIPARANKPFVDGKNPQAVAFKYVEKSADKQCKTCQHFTAASGTDGGECKMIPGFLVKGAGTCSMYLKK